VANQVITGLSALPAGPCAFAPELAPAAVFYNAVGFTHTVIDVFGYFSNANGIAGPLARSRPGRPTPPALATSWSPRPATADPASGGRLTDRPIPTGSAHPPGAPPHP
jgi:hypothetical protein